MNRKEKYLHRFKKLYRFKEFSHSIVQSTLYINKPMLSKLKEAGVITNSDDDGLQWNQEVIPSEGLVEALLENRSVEEIQSIAFQGASITSAIRLLKKNGYRILAPTTNYKEI